MNAAAGALSPPTETDAVVIGAGPVGLFQVFQLGLQDIRAHVVDSLAMPGGQCAELYPDKPIYDIPGLPLCTGRELTERLLQQIRPFDTPLHLGQEVAAVEPRGAEAGGGFEVATAAGLRWRCKVVIVAGGVGAFQHKRLPLPGIERFQGSQLLHPGVAPEDFAGQHVLVAGGGHAAVDEAVALAQALADGDPSRAASVTLLHRRETLAATPEALARWQTLRDAGVLRFVVGQPIAFDEADGRLQALSVACADGETRPLRADRVLVCLGLSPRLGAIADWGLGLERKQVVVDTERFQTAVPGIFAVGDINTYPGKKKLIVCGFHEATLAAFAAAERVFPERRQLLQYTTTSTRLHQLLGVASPTKS